MINTICLIGQSGSGKSTAATILNELYGYKRCDISNQVRLLATEQQIADPTREILQLLATQARATLGNDYFARRSLSPSLADGHIVFEGIRHLDELDYLRSVRDGKFIVCGLHADRETRFQRVLLRARKSDPTNYEQFVRNDEREWGIEATNSSQNTKLLMQLSDHVIFNDGGLLVLTDGIRRLIDRYNLDVRLEGSIQTFEAYTNCILRGKERL